MTDREFIPQTYPLAGYLAHKPEIDEAVARVLASGWYILGQEVDSFEAEFATYTGVDHAVGVANGTDAIEIALRACGVGKGDLVFTVSHTAVATVAAIARTGAKAVLVDVDPATFTIDAAELESAIDAAAKGSLGAPRAIVPVHLYGHPANMPAIMDTARAHGLVVVEDCAQAHGSSLAGKGVGCWGDLATYSFYPTKNMGALGDSGMVVCNDASLAAEVRAIREYGWKDRYVSAVRGVNSRLDAVQAAILRVRLKYLDSDNSRRQEVARTYLDALEGSGLVLPSTRTGATHVYHQFVVRSNDRDRLADHLRNEGVGTGIHYPKAVHQQVGFADDVLCPAPLLASEAAVKEILSLPMYPELSDESVGVIVEQISEFQRGK